jgi:putative transcriptional regulator
MSNRIKEIREEKGISQEKLSEITGIVRPYISNLENNNTNPTQKTMRIIAEALESSVEFIFFSSV